MGALLAEWSAGKERKRLVADDRVFRQMESRQIERSRSSRDWDLATVDATGVTSLPETMNPKRTFEGSVGIFICIAVATYSESSGSSTIRFIVSKKARLKASSLA